MLLRFILLRANTQKKIQKNTEYRCASNTGNLHPKERNVAAKLVLTAKANNHDGRNNRYIF